MQRFVNSAFAKIFYSQSVGNLKNCRLPCANKIGKTLTLLSYYF